METSSSLKGIACEEIEEKKNLLNDVSRMIWEKPELAFEETHAHDLLADVFEKNGFTVEKNTPLQTSFIARYGIPGGPRIGILCEYDALPGVGHACGHNLIAEAGLAAALGLKSVLSHENGCKGQLIVYGTPAEESGGGKILMMQKGCFKDIDICMIVHPNNVDILDGSDFFIAREGLQVTYTGKAAHAAASPWEGINAVDAAAACYTSVSMMRQQIKPTCRVHGIISDGGQKPNIIPVRSQLLFYLRAPTPGGIEDLKTKLFKCAEGAALATGCTLKIEPCALTYLNVLKNNVFTNTYKKNMETLGLKPMGSSRNVASSDVGNVSFQVPTIHPLFGIPAQNSLHTEVFKEAAGAEEAQAPTLRAGKAMAMTAIDILTNSGLLKEITEEFESSKEMALKTA